MNVMLRGTLLGAATVAFGGGCRTWRAVPLIPGEARPLPATARAVRPTGERVELAGGRVTPDSVIGVRRGRGGPGPDAAGGRVAIPRDSVMFVEERRLSWGRSLGAVGGVYLAAGFLLGVLVAASGF
jgi:hypothetical protein